MSNSSAKWILATAGVAGIAASGIGYLVWNKKSGKKSTRKINFKSFDLKKIKSSYQKFAPKAKAFAAKVQKEAPKVYKDVSKRAKPFLANAGSFANGALKSLKKNKDEIIITQITPPSGKRFSWKQIFGKKRKASKVK
jgi:hypothetical protein